MSSHRVRSVAAGWLALAVWLGVGNAGCGTTAASRQTALREAVTEYCTAMRWGNVDKASHYIPDALRDSFLRQKRAAQAQMTIHDYEVRSVDYTLGSDRARIVVLAAWSQPADPVVHEDLLAQHWRYRDNRWQLLHQEKIQRAEGKPVRPDEGL